MLQATRAYTFFQHVCQSKEHFTLQELAKASGYAIGTIEAYRTKKWSQILFPDGKGQFICKNMEHVSLERFKNHLRQKSDFSNLLSPVSKSFLHPIWTWMTTMVGNILFFYVCL
jgi:hypothetical protein